MEPPHALRGQRETRALDPLHGKDDSQAQEVKALIHSIRKQVEPCLTNVDEQVGAEDEEECTGIKGQSGKGEDEGKHRRVGRDMGKHGVPFLALHHGHPGVLEPVVSQKMASQEEKKLFDEEKEDGGHGATSFL
ncbi:MAG: hypothetical protein UX57_C0003G0049 [Candidatus Uhrbacteria bacterium GW2011_GWE2_46_68]|uniref:Uncharacterized protein n=2 Tax=Candidatus Uhriibacteriota TaxID=1752732 RepID=A0A0G1Q971_9BACT|nr:MAG: hypothetical protein UX45_C0005G0042 [Candidatus Uhrbacteria bacterium GW2011_GWF2_46_218]KKU41549.1 MAG: hypothetical protein UX57_C0003G0049 [Candidatus Uhrbacteria bacterium GW2011_GWE2_46_68]